MVRVGEDYLVVIGGAVIEKYKVSGPDGDPVYLDVGVGVSRDTTAAATSQIDLSRMQSAFHRFAK